MVGCDTGKNKIFDLIRIKRCSECGKEAIYYCYNCEKPFCEMHETQTEEAGNSCIVCGEPLESMENYRKRDRVNGRKT